MFCKNYRVAIATLGIGIKELLEGVEEWHWIKPEVTNSQFIYNMGELYAWNLRGSFGFDSDGLCVFINWD